MTGNRIGTREEWVAASAELLKREKELTRMGDELSRQRQELPWVPVEKQYMFQTERGARTLADLFEGRSQLVVYHFMFGPDWEAGGTWGAVSPRDTPSARPPAWASPSTTATRDTPAAGSS